LDKFTRENGLCAGLEPSGDPPSALPEKAPPATVPVSIIEYSQFVLNEIFQDIFGRRKKMSELTQVGLEGDASDTLNWQPATAEEKVHAKAVWEKKTASVKTVDPNSSLGAAVLRFYRRFWSR
jgi:hypothetical protein